MDKQKEVEPKQHYDRCDKSHVECPNGNGTCDRAVGHDGSHRCGSCYGSF